jgi:hypothetical protein
VRTFKTAEEMRQALLAFRETSTTSRWLNATASSARPNIAAGSFNRPLRQRRLQSSVPKTAGGTRPISFTSSAILQYQQQCAVELRSASAAAIRSANPELRRRDEARGRLALATGSRQYSSACDGAQLRRVCKPQGNTGYRVDAGGKTLNMVIADIT